MDDPAIDGLHLLWIMLTREIMNGMWFVISIAMFFGFVIFCFKRLRRGDTYNDIGAAIAMATFFAGSIIRSGYVWLAFAAKNAGDDAVADWIGSYYEVLFVATFLMTLGGLCCFRQFTPDRWKPWSWIVLGVLSISVPLALHRYIN